MSWILVIYIVASGVTFIDYSSKEACLEAAKVVASLDRSNVRVACVVRD